MRLINADALKEELRNSWIRKAKMPMEADPFLAFAMSDIDNAPTIDAEPVVRCKDCKYARNIESEWICEHLSGMVGLNVLVNDDDFCSYGERREP